MNQTQTEQLMLKSVRKLEADYKMREEIMFKEMFAMEQEMSAIKSELQKLKDMYLPVKDLFTSLQSLSDRLKGGA